MAPSTSSAAARILCYGDSLTAGYCGTPNMYSPYATNLSQKLNVTVDHVGLSGLRADEMVANLTNSCCFDIFRKSGPGLAVQLAQHKYSCCILMAGTNDLGANRGADAIFADLKQLHQQCHSRGVRTIAITIPESQFIAQNGMSFPALVRQQVNQKLSAWAATQSKRVLFIDMASHLPFSPFTGDWAADGLHLTQQGYARFGFQLAKLLRQSLSSTFTTAPKKVPLSDATNTMAVLTTAPSFGVAQTAKSPFHASPGFAKASWNTGDDFYPKYLNFSTLVMAANSPGLVANISPSFTSATLSSWTVV
eukprot:GGOE01055274.1.p1 GENE.GGOE01055274.1~~GGOE01055274.1.p1  ORF type:complete len:307 (+),score=69.03 GGOE01055274.1:26-946(+)